MAQYAIAFDMYTKAMKAAGMRQSDIVVVYQTEIPEALAACGFVVHPQGSLYHTNAECNPITAIMTLRSTVQSKALNFCRYVRRVHVFRMEEWSDVTSLIRTEPQVGEHVAVPADEEADQNELTGF